MSRITLYTRSFHPDANFGAGGLGFKGDNRGFSDSLHATARIYSHVTINLVSASFENLIARSDPSENAIPRALNDLDEASAARLGISAGPNGNRVPESLKLPRMRNDYSQERKKPRVNLSGSISPYRPDGDQAVSGRLTYAGKNFAFYFSDTDAGHWFFGGNVSNGESDTEGGSWKVWERWGGVVPDLDVSHEFGIRINRTKQSAHITSAIAGDGFPNCESFLLDTANSTLFLASHIRMGTAATQLPGGRALPMMRTSMIADWQSGDFFGGSVDIHLANDYTGDGSPHQVVASGTMSRSSWNSAHLKRDASGDWLRQVEDNVPLPRQSIRHLKERIRGAF